MQPGWLLNLTTDLLHDCSQAVRVWLFTLPATLQQYADRLTSPGGLLLSWDEQVRGLVCESWLCVRPSGPSLPFAACICLLLPRQGSGGH